VINPNLSTFVLSRRLGPFDTLALPLPYKAPLHLRDHSQNGQHQMPHFAPRCHMRIQHGHEGAALLAIMDDVEHILGIAT
jgi:hypothetical protein